MYAGFFLDQGQIMCRTSELRHHFEAFRKIAFFAIEFAKENPVQAPVFIAAQKLYQSLEISFVHIVIMQKSNILPDLPAPAGPPVGGLRLAQK